MYLVYQSEASSFHQNKYYLQLVLYPQIHSLTSSQAQLYVCCHCTQLNASEALPNLFHY